jgi:hypothetical protein
MISSNYKFKTKTTSKKIKKHLDIYKVSQYCPYDIQAPFPPPILIMANSPQLNQRLKKHSLVPKAVVRTPSVVRKTPAIPGRPFSGSPAPTLPVSAASHLKVNRPVLCCQHPSHPQPLPPPPILIMANSPQLNQRLKKHSLVPFAAAATVASPT